jgi:LPS sulfotransferase NodH
MVKPRVSYVICATPRSGSHLLAEALQTTGLAGAPDEYLLCDDDGRLQNEQGLIAERYGKMTLDEFRSLILKLGSTPNSVCGLIIMWHYLPDILRNYRQLPQYQRMKDPELMDALLVNPRYILLIRRDRVAQAVSWARAFQTGIWSQPEGVSVVPRQEPRFDFQLIDRLHRRVLASEVGWANFFKMCDVEPYKVVYEDLVEAYEQTALSALDYLEIPYPESLAFGERKLQKQADGLNDAWAERYTQIRHSPASKLAYFAERVWSRVRLRRST